MTTRSTAWVLLLASAGALPACRQAQQTPAPGPAPTASAPAPIPVGVPAPANPPLAPLSPGARIEDERNTIEVFRRAAAASVFVTQQQLVVDYYAGRALELPAGSGSGFVWDEQGHIVTNFHVIRGARSLTVTLQNQKSYPAKLVGAEARKDVAVLKIAAPRESLQPIERYPGPPTLEVGQKTVAIGNPFGFDHTVTTGIVSALGREVDGVGGVTIRDMVQTDAAINPGNSGGPLLDSSGRLIGMNTMIFSKSGSSAGIGFAVPASTIARIVPQLIKNGRVQQVGVGVRIDPQQRLERRNGLKGVIVLEVLPNSPAAKAGLRGLTRTPNGIALGDLIVGVDDVKVEDYDDLYNALDTRSPGETAKLKLRRGDTLLEVSVELSLVE